MTLSYLEDEVQLPPLRYNAERGHVDEERVVAMPPRRRRRPSPSLPVAIAATSTICRLASIEAEAVRVIANEPSRVVADRLAADLSQFLAQSSRVQGVLQAFPPLASRRIIVPTSFLATERSCSVAARAPCSACTLSRQVYGTSLVVRAPLELELPARV